MILLDVALLILVFVNTLKKESPLLRTQTKKWSDITDFLVPNAADRGWCCGRLTFSLVLSNNVLNSSDVFFSSWFYPPY